MSNKIKLGTLRKLIRESVLREAPAESTSNLIRRLHATAQQLSEPLGIDVTVDDVANVNKFVKTFTSRKSAMAARKHFYAAANAWSELASTAYRVAKDNSDYDEEYDIASTAEANCKEIIDDIDYKFAESDEDAQSKSKMLAGLFDVYVSAKNGYMNSHSQTPMDAFRAAKTATRYLPALRKKLYPEQGFFPVMLRNIKAHNSWNKISKNEIQAMIDAASD